MVLRKNAREHAVDNDDNPPGENVPLDLPAGKGLFEGFALAVAIEYLRHGSDAPIEDPDACR